MLNFQNQAFDGSGQHRARLSFSWRKFSWAFVFALALALGSSSEAGEVYSLVMHDCTVRSGLIVDVLDGQIRLLTLDGGSTQARIEDVDSIYIYSFVENPIRTIKLDPTLADSLRAIYLDDSDEPSFYGWPVRFVESLAMFYDIQGKSHVYETESLVRIRPGKGAVAPAKAASSTPLALDRSGLSARCATPDRKAGDSRPTRVLTDEIKVRQFFEDLERGYDSLRGYEERTYLYARPMIFDQKTRFGLSFVNSPIERTLVVPVYVQWSTGRPYRFQSFNVFGRAENEFLPNAEPFFGFRNDLKAHAFHSHFSGNLVALSAGTRNYFSGAVALDDAKDRAKYGTTEYLSTVNYLALMGLDYGPFSVSGGFYYPTHGLRSGSEVREVLANRVSYAARAMATYRKARFRLIGSTSTFESGAPGDTDLLAKGARDSALPDSYSFTSKFVRGGTDWRAMPGLSISGDLIVEDGDYAEKFGTVNNAFKARTRSVVASLRQEFSDYVAVVATGVWTWREFDASFFGSTNSRNDQVFRYGGAFEFVF